MWYNVPYWNTMSIVQIFMRTSWLGRRSGQVIINAFWSHVSRVTKISNLITFGTSWLKVCQVRWSLWSVIKALMSLLLMFTDHVKMFWNKYSHRLQSTSSPSDSLPRGFFWAAPICDGCEATNVQCKSEYWFDHLDTLVTQPGSISKLTYNKTSQKILNLPKSRYYLEA